MLAVTCFCAWCQGVTLALVAVWPGLRAPVAGLQRLGRVRGVAAARLVMLVSGGGGCCGLSAVWEIVAEAARRRCARRVMRVLSPVVRARQARILRMLAAISSSAVK